MDGMSGNDVYVTYQMMDDPWCPQTCPKQLMMNEMKTIQDNLELSGQQGSNVTAIGLMSTPNGNNPVIVGHDGAGSNGYIALVDNGNGMFKHR